MMLIPTAVEVDGMIRKIPRGQVSTLAEIRKRLAGTTWTRRVHW
jgi:alkylated DNA nucleotide flippase Atl1